MAKRFWAQWLILASISLALFAVVTTWLMVASRSGRITKANYDKIEVGTTTIQQVRELLRCEHTSEVVFDDHFSGDTGLCFREGKSPDLQFVPCREIYVVLDYDRIVKKSFYQPTLADVIERLVYRARQIPTR